MHRDDEIALIKEVIGLADQRSAYLDKAIAHSPIARYASEQRFAAEQDGLFRKAPVVAAHSSELDGPQSFLTKTLYGLPLLLIRDEDGRAQAFLNVCRHRGAKLERESAGCKRVFTCPYHGWSWTNRGDLRAVPQEIQGFPDLPRDDRALRRLPVAEGSGFIWIIADPESVEGIDLDTWLRDLQPDFEWLSLAHHRIAVEETIEVAANWKLLVEGGIEAYHFRVAHKATIAPYFPDNLSTYQMFGPHIRSILPRTTMMTLRDVPEDNWAIRRDANMVYTLMPTTQLLVQQDHIVWILAEPLSANRTRLRLATLVPKDTEDTPDMQAHWDKNHKITHVTLMEDFDLGEDIQAGFASRGNPSHLFGRFEAALNHFNRAVEGMIGVEDAAASP